MFLFFEDICGETKGIKMPRHAKSWGDGKSIKDELNLERSKAIKSFKDEVKNNTYPDDDHIVEMLPGEKDILLEKLDSLYNEKLAETSSRFRNYRYRLQLYYKI